MMLLHPNYLSGFVKHIGTLKPFQILLVEFTSRQFFFINTFRVPTAQDKQGK